jgi:hypothetical protein
VLTKPAIGLYPEPVQSSPNRQNGVNILRVTVEYAGKQTSTGDPGRGVGGRAYNISKLRKARRKLNVILGTI